MSLLLEVEAPLPLPPAPILPPRGCSLLLWMELWLLGTGVSGLPVLADTTLLLLLAAALFDFLRFRGTFVVVVVLPVLVLP